MDAGQCEHWPDLPEGNQNVYKGGHVGFARQSKLINAWK